jgi:hypothetical protein
MTLPNISETPQVALYQPPQQPLIIEPTPAQVDLVTISHASPDVEMHALEALRLSATQSSVVEPQVLNKMEMGARYTNNLALHLAFSDGPALLSIAANTTGLPPGLDGALGFFNVFNTFTGVAAIAADIRETRGTFRNPNATQLDKIMDVTHLVAGDVVSTAASLVPVIAPLTGPIAMGFFVGGQLVGVGMDLLKTGYDFKRKGQQSAAPPAPQE